MIKISIGIAAYNAELNIASIVTSILNQNSNTYELLGVFIHSDQSSDGTIKAVKSLGDSKVKVIESNERKGFAGSLLVLFEAMPGDVLITLNDDIKITDKDFIKNLIKPFILNSNVGMVCGNTQPLSPKSFIESAINSTFRAYDSLGESMKDGNSVFSVDGKIMAFSSKALKTFKYPDDKKLMGNVDAFLYFACITNGFKYLQARDAVAYYRNPSTLKDYLNWTIRNNSTIKVLETFFGHIVNDEYKYSKISLYKYIFREVVRNPLGSIFILITRIYIGFKVKKYSSNFEEKWEVIETSKLLD